MSAKAKRPVIMVFEDEPQPEDGDKSPFVVGVPVKAERHCYSNAVGGTEIGGAVAATPVKVWWDYETGWHCRATTADGKDVSISEFDLEQ